jgi:D-arabinose 1-dehydrogenase-like Zn-dependent alcohol dehydrogenase
MRRNLQYVQYDVCSVSHRAIPTLRHSGAGLGDIIAVLGVGGRGHLGVQFAARMGANLAHRR